jgi:hypothetical protein
MTAFPANLSLVAPPGTLTALHGAIKARMSIVAAAFPLLATKDPTVQRAPTVGDGWLPPKTAGADDQYPFLLVRPSGGTDTEQSADQNATADVDIVIGTFSDSDDGWLDVLLIIDAIRADLGAAPSIVGTAFEQTGPSTWQIPEEQPRPQWLGVVKTKWTVPRPQRVEARNPEEG